MKRYHSVTSEDLRLKSKSLFAQFILHVQDVLDQVLQMNSSVSKIHDSIPSSEDHLNRSSGNELTSSVEYNFTL